MIVGWRRLSLYIMIIGSIAAIIKLANAWISKSDDVDLKSNLYFNQFSRSPPPTDPKQITQALRQWKHHLGHSNDHALTRRIENHLFPAFKVHPSEMFHNRSHHYGQEKGIVMCVGENQRLSASILIRNLRVALKCSLPIEIFYRGSRDLSPSSQRYLKSLGKGIEARNIEDYVHDNIAGLEGWSLKPFALLQSSFRKAILVDADTIFLYNPEYILDDEPNFQNSGTLFFKDRTFSDLPDYNIGWIRSFFDVLPKHLEGYRIMNHESGHEQESGVVAVDKFNFDVFTGLVGTCYLNLRNVRETQTYKFLHGDKETFWLGFSIMESRYEFSDNLPGNLGDILMIEGDKDMLLSSKNLTQAKVICGRQLLHFTSSNNSKGNPGRPFWFNGGVMKNKYEPEFSDLMISVPLFVREVCGKSYWILGNQAYACLIVPEGLGRYETLSPKELSSFTETISEANLELEKFKSNKK